MAFLFLCKDKSQSILCYNQVEKKMEEGRFGKENRKRYDIFIAGIPAC